MRRHDEERSLRAAIDRFDAITTRLLPPLTLGGLLLGLAFSLAGNEVVATWCWAIPSLLVGTWLTISIIRDLLRGEAGVDLIAVLAIVGALLLGEALAAAVIGVMLAQPGSGSSDTPPGAPTGNSLRSSRAPGLASSTVTGPAASRTANRRGDGG